MPRYICVCLMVYNLSMNNGVNLQNVNKITNFIWTNGVECGKICIGEQPGFYTWRSEVLALRRGGMYMVTLEMLTCMFTFGLLIVAILSSNQDK